MATAEKTSRIGRNICTVHYFGGLAMDFCARDLTRRAEKEPIMATKWTTRHVGIMATKLFRRSRPATRKDNGLARNF